MKKIKRLINSKESLIIASIALSLSTSMYNLLEIKTLMAVSASISVYFLYKFMFDDSIEALYLPI